MARQRLHLGKPPRTARFEILRRDWSSITNQKSLLETLLLRLNLKASKELEMGQPWIHGVEPNEVDLYQPLKHVEGHSLWVGTTGSGKTRAFDVNIAQAIMRNEVVIIIDPKGDKEMRDNARRTCEAMGTRSASYSSILPSRKSPCE